MTRWNRPGVCRWCKCSEFDPCPSGCGWANRDQTLCTACVNVDREWKQRGSRPPNMTRAFFRGFIVGSDDERAEHGLTGGRGERAIASNPYPDFSATSRVWQAGFEAGRRHG